LKTVNDQINDQAQSLISYEKEKYQNALIKSSYP
jgi:hypothetical protein